MVVSFVAQPQLIRLGLVTEFPYLLGRVDPPTFLRVSQSTSRDNKSIELCSFFAVIPRLDEVG